MEWEYKAWLPQYTNMLTKVTVGLMDRIEYWIHKHMYKDGEDATLREKKCGRLSRAICQATVFDIERWKGRDQMVGIRKWYQRSTKVYLKDLFMHKSIAWRCIGIICKYINVYNSFQCRRLWLSNGLRSHLDLSFHLYTYIFGYDTVTSVLYINITMSNNIRFVIDLLRWESM